MYIGILRIALRIIAWISAGAIFVVLFAALLLTNINALTPPLAQFAAARLGGELSFDEVGIGWVDQFAVLRVKNLALQRDTPLERSELSIDELELRVAQPSSQRANWEIASIDLVNPRITSHRSGKAPAAETPGPGDSSFTANFPSSIASLAYLREINVTGGEYDFEFEAREKPIKVTGRFLVEGQSQDNASYITFQLTSNEFPEMLVSVKVASARQPDGSMSTDMELVANSAQVARLAPFLADIPRVARIDLARQETVVDANAHAHWQDSELQSVNFTVSATDPNLDGKIPGTKHASLSAKGVLSLDTAGEADMEVEFELNSVDMAAALAQVPGAFTPKFYNHASERLDSLWLNEMRGRLSGNPRELLKPEGDWKLTAEGEFSNCTYRFGSKWPPLEDAAGSFAIDNKKAVITGTQGAIHGHPIRHSRATIDNLAHADPVMAVRVGIDLPFGVAIDLFGEEGIVSAGKLNWIESGEGEGAIEVAVDVPLRRGKEFVVAGAVEISSADLLTAQSVELEGLSGRLDFNRFGITAGDVSGQMLGGEFNTQFTGSGTAGSYTTTGKAAGEARAEALNSIVKGPIAERLSGSLNWDADYVFTSEQSEINLSASLVDVVSTLPFPMLKGAGADMPLNLKLRTTGGSERTLDLSLGPLAKASVAATLRDETWRVHSGFLSVGNVPSQQRGGTGVNVLVDLPQLDYDAWSGLLKGTTHSGEFRLADAVRNVEIKAEKLNLPGQYELQNADILAKKQDSHWDVALLTDTVKGTATYVSDEFAHEGEPPRLDIDLSVCHLATSDRKHTKKPADPAELPKLKFRCADTRYGQYKLGQSEIDAEPGADSWRITRANFNSPHFSIQATGDWFYNQSSRIDFNLNSLDFGSTLKDLGYPNRFKRGKTQMSGTLEWDAALTRWNTEKVSGDVKISSSDGTIVSSSSPEALKVVGALNYDTIFNRFSHDVVDVLEDDGILYDKLNGTAALKNGVFEVGGVFIEGPSMSMAMTGTSDWNTKQHNLTLGVEPKIRNSLTTLATVLINPLTGAFVYVGGKLAEEMKIIFSYRYDITGSWDKPNVKQAGLQTGSLQLTPSAKINSS